MPDLGYAAGAGLALSTIPLQLSQFRMMREQGAASAVAENLRDEFTRALRARMGVSPELRIFPELTEPTSAFYTKAGPISALGRTELRSAGLSEKTIEHLVRRGGVATGAGSPTAILAHELGHATGWRPPQFIQYAKKLMRPAMVASPILAAHMVGPESSTLGAAGKGALIGGGLGGAVMSPVLAEEIRATMRAIQGLRQTGMLAPQQLAAARKMLGLRGALGTYLAGALLPTAGLGAIGATYGRRAALAKKEETARRLQKALQTAEGR